MDFPINVSSELTPESAYCIGAIISSEKSYEYKGKTYYLAIVRHNANRVAERDLKKHVALLRKIAQKTTGRILMKDKLVERGWFERSKDGFAIVFHADKAFESTELVGKARQLLENASTDILRSFLVGAYDGRGYWDKHLKRMVIDCRAETQALLAEILLKFQIRADENAHRGTDERRTPRENQFRITRQDSGRFFSEIGLISPGKIGKIIELAAATPLTRDVSDLLPGLTTLVEFNATKPKRVISQVEKRDVELDRKHEETCLREIGDISIPKNISKKPEYSGKPKEKQERQVSGGRTYYPRNHKTAVNALIMADFKCEYNETHETFIRRKDGHPYTEPHHLVPLSYSGEFPVSLDVEENILSLCSTCHNHLHYGKDIKPLLKKLFLEREEHLRKVGIAITFEQLLKMYKQ